MKKRTVSLLCVCLALLMLFSLASCGSGENEGATKEPVTERPTVEGETLDPELSLYDDLPEVNYAENGVDKPFKILNSDSTWGLVIMDATEISTPIDSAIYGRNRYLEENLGIEILVTQMEYHDVYNTINNQVMGNLYEYDICYNEGWKQMEMVQNNIYKSVRSYDRYLDFSKPWWYQDVMSDITLSDNLYLVAGDMNMMLNDSLWCMAFNVDIINRFNQTSPYRLVEDGDWTFENLHKLSKETLTQGKYGIVSHIAFATALLNGANVSFTQRDDDGSVVRTPLKDRFVSVYQDMVEMFFENNEMGGENGIRTEYNSENYTSGKFPADQFNHHNIFTAGNATFHAGTVGDMRVYMPSSEIEYGIVPIPKYESKQEKYVSYMYRAGSMCGIPANIDGQPEGTLERVCTVMEWMCAYSYKTVKPVYYEVILYGRISRQPEAVEMLKIVFGLTENGIKHVELDTVMNFGMVSKFENQISDCKPGAANQINAIGTLVNSLIAKAESYYANTLPG